MRSSTSGRSGWPFAGALLALLVGGLVATPKVRAGCSHDGLSRDRQTGVTARFELLGRAGALATAADGMPNEGHGQPAPCSGAMCSGAPVFPLLPAPSIPGPRGAWAILESPVPHPGSGSTPAEFDDPSPRPLYAGAAIFHPPRPVARHVAP